MKLKNKFLYIAIFSLFLTFNRAGADIAPSEKKGIVAAYLQNKSKEWQPVGNRPHFASEMIDTELLTDLYCAFASIGYLSKEVSPQPRLTGDYSIQPSLSDDISRLYPELVAVKKRAANGMNLFLSLGGWDFNDPGASEGKATFHLFSAMISQKESRKQFIDSAISYAHLHGFDGIDIDWEYPGDLSRGGREEDFVNFPLFLEECFTSFHSASPPILLSYAAAVLPPAGVPRKFIDKPEEYYKWLSSCSRYLDRITAMAYDYHTPQEGGGITGVNAPLNKDTKAESGLTIAATLNNYIVNGVPKEKIVLGIPLYGHSYKGVKLTAEDNSAGKNYLSPGDPGPSIRSKGVLGFYEIADMIANKQLVFGVDGTTNTAYGYNIPAGIWVSFDTAETVKLKAEKALEMGLGGIIFWSIEMDEYHWKPSFPLIRSGSEVFKGIHSLQR